MRALTIAGVSILGFIGMTAGWVKLQESFGVFYPTEYAENRLERLPPEIQFVRFPSEDGTSITGLLRAGDPGEPALVFAHGNAGNMMDRLPWFELALPSGWTGLMVDYRGYGLSEGTPSVKGAKEDVKAAADYALTNTPADRLFLHGRSLGVPMVAHAGQHVSLEGMILESGFPDAGAVAEHIFPVPGISYLISIELDTVEYLRKAQDGGHEFPKLIIHGSSDGILPLELGRELHAEAPEPKDWWLVDGAGHNDLMMVAGEEYPERLKEFLTATKDG
jgi:hypothetical protein